MSLGSSICFASFRARDAPGIVVPARWSTAKKPALSTGSPRRNRSAQIIPSRTPRLGDLLTITGEYCTVGASRRQRSQEHGSVATNVDCGNALLGIRMPPLRPLVVGPVGRDHGPGEAARRMPLPWLNTATSTGVSPSAHGPLPSAKATSRRNSPLRQRDEQEGNPHKPGIGLLQGSGVYQPVDATELDHGDGGRNRILHADWLTLVDPSRRGAYSIPVG